MDRDVPAARPNLSAKIKKLSAAFRAQSLGAGSKTPALRVVRSGEVAIAPPPAFKVAPPAPKVAVKGGGKVVVDTNDDVLSKIPASGGPYYLVPGVLMAMAKELDPDDIQLGHYRVLSAAEAEAEMPLPPGSIKVLAANSAEARELQAKEPDRIRGWRVGAPLDQVLPLDPATGTRPVAFVAGGFNRGKVFIEPAYGTVVTKRPGVVGGGGGSRSGSGGGAINGVNGVNGTHVNGINGTHVNGVNGTHGTGRDSNRRVITGRVERRTSGTPNRLLGVSHCAVGACDCEGQFAAIRSNILALADQVQAFNVELAGTREA